MGFPLVGLERDVLGFGFQLVWMDGVGFGFGFVVEWGTRRIRSLFRRPGVLYAKRLLCVLGICNLAI